jgi:hypothetical protein
VQHYRQLNLFRRVFAVATCIAVLAACGGQAATIPPTVAPAQAPTSVPATPTLAPTVISAATATPPPTTTPAPTATPEPTITAEALQTTPTASVGANQANLPVPDDAVDFAQDPESGDIDFNSASDVNTLVKFYRDALAGLGWQVDEAGATVNDTLGSLDFTKGDAGLSLTILNAGVDSHVSITTTGMVAQGAETPGVTPESTSQPSGPLTAVDKDGLPAPADYTEYVGDSGMYRSGLAAASPSSLKSVLKLYRDELAVRKWHELPSTVAPTDSQAALMFDSPDQGRLELNLTRNANGGTDISLVVRAEAAAQKAGILPPAGKSRIYFGNINDAAVTFNIAEKDIKVAAGNQNESDMKNVPSLDLAPGKYDFTLTLSGKTPIKDTITVAAGETWALAAGPGGALSLQMY